MSLEILFSTLKLHASDHESETVLKAEPVYNKVLYKFNIKDISRRRVSAGFLRRKVLRTMRNAAEQNLFLNEFVWHLN